MSPPLVTVEWGDAHQSGDEPMTVDEMHCPCVTTSAGYLLRRDKTGITIAGCIDEDGIPDRMLFILAGMVRKVVTVRR